MRVSQSITLSPTQAGKHVLDQRSINVELSNGMADVFFWPVSEQIQFGLVRPQNSASRTDAVKADAGVLDEIAQFDLARADLLCGFLANPGYREMRADVGHQLAGAERFNQVIIRTGLQALDAALLPGPGREQDDRDLAQLRIGAQLDQ